MEMPLAQMTNALPQQALTVPIVSAVSNPAMPVQMMVMFQAFHSPGCNPYFLVGVPMP